MLIDTHCHLYFNSFIDDLDAVLERARQQGVQRIVIPATDVPSSQQTIAICEAHPGLYAAVGVHPNDALTWTDSSLAELRSLARHPKVVAIGEIGLDFYRDFAPIPLQQEILNAQLELAAEIEKPVILHARQSFSTLWPILSAWQHSLARATSPLANHPGVLHSFEGNLEDAQQVILQGFCIGITGPVTYRNAGDKHRLVSSLGLDHLLLETDAPYLSPLPFRGQRNEPAHIAIIAAKVAELTQRSLSEVAELTSANANRLFLLE